jgi:rhodanese-related sulfurtransferase
MGSLVPKLCRNPECLVDGRDHPKVIELVDLARRNMKGGILAWSDKVDPSVPKY